MHKLRVLLTITVIFSIIGVFYNYHRYQCYKNLFKKFPCKEDMVWQRMKLLNSNGQ
ncbi:hypothetical protein SAMN05661012_06627 [Chitinophaga sancti]|uniref:Uncharacterized protein n=1 Tax=Chitinophaga sancti TaxID=1004 RepID=A0A1K1T1Z4_9BACT|nr:hypothetical protein SAMN05661012_06627 [Chitinophaga sancti]